MKIETTILDRLCPLHVAVNRHALITHAGPTFRKMRPEADPVGAHFFDMFELSRPRGLRTMEQVLSAAGTRLYLKLRAPPHTPFKALAVADPSGGGAVVNLSFGIGITDAVARYGLTSADFADTDLTVEMLYLVEAKSAAMEESRKLIARLQGARIAAEEQAFTDTLTGLKNRRAVDHVLGRLIARNEPFAIVHLDLDFFKAVNDTLGHAAGDHVLQAVAGILVEETRSDDTVARVGGDEFIIVLTGRCDRRRIELAVGRMIGRIEAPMQFQGQPLKVSCSAGTTLSETYARPEIDRMLADADSALYASKHKGRACHSFFEPAAPEDNAPCTVAQGITPQSPVTPFAGSR